MQGSVAKLRFGFINQTSEAKPNDAEASIEPKWTGRKSLSLCSSMYGSSVHNQIKSKEKSNEFI